jgi:hypothetical protein
MNTNRQKRRVIEGPAYTKEHTPADVVTLVRDRHGYTPADVIDAGTVWIATRPEGQEIPQARQGVAQGATQGRRAGLVGELLTGEQLRLF